MNRDCTVNALHKIPEGCVSQSPLHACYCPFVPLIVYTAPRYRASSRHRLQFTSTPAVNPLPQCSLLLSIDVCKRLCFCIRVCGETEKYCFGVYDVEDGPKEPLRFTFSTPKIDAPGDDPENTCMHSRRKLSPASPHGCTSPS